MLLARLSNSEPCGAASLELKKIQAQISLDESEVSQAPTGPALELRSLWGARLENSLQTRKLVPGLQHLMRNLREMADDEPVDQFQVFSDNLTSLVFFKAGSDKLIGAIVTIRSEEQRRRSLANLLAANGGSH
jgi:hypothetical protein